MWWTEVDWLDDGGECYQSQRWDYSVENPAKARALADKLRDGHVIRFQTWSRLVPHGETAEQDVELGAPLYLSNRRVKLVIELEASILHPDWTIEDLCDNGVHYLISMLDDGQKRNHDREGPGHYWFDEGDMTLWTVDGYTEDLNDLQPAQGWWHPNVKDGRVHEHPETPGRGWSEASHRLCEQVYLRPQTLHR